MKKLAAILLIVVLFFNWYGYRILTGFLEEQADQHLEARLDNHEYDESQLIEVKVALNVPYQNNQSEFERHYGEMQVDGKFYTYVKRKIENGYLILKCIPNDSKQQIKDAGNDFFKMTNGIDQHPQQEKKQNNTAFKSLLGDFDDQLNNFDICMGSDLLAKHHLHNAYALYHVNQSTTEHPPDTFRAFVG